MDLIQAIIIAIIEGLTEYLPVSSTAHMIFTSSIFGIQEDEFVKMFQVSIQFKANLITTKETIPTIADNYKNGTLSLYGFASDQSPKPSSAYHWAPFMGHIVPVHTGAEMLAKRFDMNVIFLKTKKINRGYYEASFEILSEDVKSVPNYEITDQFLKLVEEQILETPEYYLWTHKRWKHKKENAQ